MFKKFLKLNLLFILFLTSTFFSYAQTSGEYYCIYNFPRNLNTGDYGFDVLELQRFLNSDSRSLISQTGIGSPGYETKLFGYKTANALKRFQTLQADKNLKSTAEFDLSTRNIINSICLENLKYFDSKKTTSTKVQTKIEIKKINSNPLSIKLSSSQSYFVNNQYKIYLNLNKEIKKITEDAIILTGGSLGSIKKLSKTSYLILINPNINSKKIYIQVEAEKVEDTDGFLNPEASNELVLNKIEKPKSTSIFAPLTNILNNLLPADVQIESQIDYLTKPELLNFLKENQKNFISNIDTNKNNFYIDPSQDVFSNEEILNLYGLKELQNNNLKVFTDITYPKNLAVSEPNNPGVLILKKIESLKPTDNTNSWNLNQSLKREAFASPSISCQRILTTSNDRLYTLFESGDKYDFKYFYTPNELSTLLIYPKLNYKYWTFSCFNERPLESRYFPEGLFCCTQEPCNLKENIYPLTYVNKERQIQLLRTSFTTEVFLGAGNQAQCIGLELNNEIRKFTRVERESNGGP